jgi:hypothetical protein
MTQSGSMAETYASTKDTTETTIVPRTISRSEQIARYFIDDLERFVDNSYINLQYALSIPPEEAQDSREVLFKLFDDLSRMLRDSMIIGIHLLLSDPDVDPNTHAYLLRYHAEYTITLPTRDIRPDKADYNAQRINGYLAPPASSWIGAKFALLIDWNPTTNQRRRSARRPEYWFDWMPRQERFDTTSLVRYREGGMAFDGATVVRRFEDRSSGF